MINNRVIKLSSSNKIFNSIKKNYNEALTSRAHNRLKGYDKNDMNSNSNKPKEL